MLFALLSPFIYLLEVVLFVPKALLAGIFLAFKVPSSGAPRKRGVVDLFGFFSAVPFGNLLFSSRLILGLIAPYTSSIDAEVVEIRPGFARVVMKDRPWLRNPFASLHAVALTNLAELASGLCVIGSLEAAGRRGIVTGLSMEFTKKARGTVTATCTLDPASIPKQGGDFSAISTITSSDGTTLCKGTFQWKVSPPTTTKKE